MPKRNNLVSTICPICGHAFSLETDYQPPVKSLESTFGYSEVNFYGGKIAGFTKATCCREYHLYWMKSIPSYKLKDIEPVDYDQFCKDLVRVMNGEDYEVANPEVAVEEPEVVVEKPEVATEDDDTVTEREADLNAGKSVDALNFFELKKYVKDTYDKSFDNKTKKVDVVNWLKENGENGEFKETTDSPSED